MAIALPTPDEVRAIIQTTLTDEQIQSVIEDASLIVTGCIAAFDPARQKAIIKWYAAHLISSSGRGGGRSNVVSKKLGDASTTYARATLGSGPMGSSYGQQAVALDPTGCIAAIGEKPVIFQVLS